MLHERLCFGCMHMLPAPEAVCPHCGHDNRIRVNDPTYLPATVLQGQYFVGKALGRGGFGITYLGYDMNLERVVAIKEYFPAAMANREAGSNTLHTYRESQGDYERGCQRALEEGRMVARMGNVPGVVQIYNVFQANGTVYIVMEYIQGVTLASMVKQAGGRIAWKQLLELMLPIMDALHTIHGMRVVHRDVSPDNIMIRQNGQAVLLDFGAAHNVSEHTASEHSVSLRMGYAPIEQYSRTGKQDGRIDEYALCATMYHALTGVKPPDATERLFEESELQALAPAGVPAAVEQVLLKGMSVKAQDRYSSVAEFKAALLAADQATPEVDPAAILRAKKLAEMNQQTQPIHSQPAAVPVDMNATLPESMVSQYLAKTEPAAVPVDMDATLPGDAVAQAMSAPRNREVEIHSVMHDATIPADAIPKYVQKPQSAAPQQMQYVKADPPAPKAPEKKLSLEEMAAQGSMSKTEDAAPVKPQKKGKPWALMLVLAAVMALAVLVLGSMNPSIDPFDGVYHHDGVNDEEYIQFTGVETHTGSSLTIPASFGHWPMKVYQSGMIAQNAFSNLNLTEVILPDNLFYIAPTAFGNPRNISFIIQGDGADTLYALGKMFEELEASDLSRDWYVKAVQTGAAIPQMRSVSVYTDKDWRDAKRVTVDHVNSILDIDIIYYYWAGEYETAHMLFDACADAGSGAAMGFLGIMYEHGYGVKKNPMTAFEWYQKAVEAGDAYSMLDLGRCYEQGIGTSVDKAKARELYQSAAEIGIEDAQEALDRMDGSQ